MTRKGDAPPPAGDEIVGIGMRLAPQKKIILQAAAEGLTDQEIADYLAVTVNTVKTHFKYMYRQLGAKNRAHAIALGCRWGLIDIGRILPAFNATR